MDARVKPAHDVSVEEGPFDLPPTKSLYPSAPSSAPITLPGSKA